MKKRSLIFAAVIAAFSLSIASAASMPNCGMPGMKHGSAAKTAPVVRIRAVRFDQAAFLVNFANLVEPGGLRLSISAGSAQGTCPHLAWAKEWRAWRARHPNVENAHYRWDGPAPIKTITIAEGLNLSAMVDEEDPEPEPPSPGFGGCGCPWDVAFSSDGCGFIHSTVYDLRRTR